MITGHYSNCQFVFLLMAVVWVTQFMLDAILMQMNQSKLGCAY